MRNLASFKDIHKDETIIVCGCGESLNNLTQPESFITIGVNDVGRLFDPTYLVVLNPRNQFKGDRFRYVENSKAKAIITQLNLGIKHPNIVRFRLGKYGSTDLSDQNVLPYTQNSPYVALCLAAHMGANCIGLIGVDFTNNHFFAKTGTHNLARKLSTIDAEYKSLGKELSRKGIEIINLSNQSRVTAFEKGNIETFLKMNTTRENQEETLFNKKCKIFFVHYKLFTCGDVFMHGLHHAAAELDIQFEEAYWDDNKLTDKVMQFNPDLLFVVHGRKFAKKFGKRFQRYNTAVWLLDEPYEVDDTSRFSGNFNTVFVNDPNTIHRHKNAHYLPVCFDPQIYYPTSDEKKYDVGFIGGYNIIRQKVLEKLCNEGLLSYVVGGPWNSGNINKLCLSKKIPAHETANLYRQTKIIVNVFREVHHFNNQKIPVFSMNPRIYEPLACGSLVISENRAEIKQVFPELPVFENSDVLVEIIKDLLNNHTQYEKTKMACSEKLNGHTFADRLKKIINITMGETMEKKSIINKMHKIQNTNFQETVKLNAEKIMLDEWEDYGGVSKVDTENSIIIRKIPDNGPGTERGLVSKKNYKNLELTFEANIESNSCFIAKIHQVDKIDQKTNSYHLMCNGRQSYFAKHCHVFKYIDYKNNSWERIKIRYYDGMISLHRNDNLVFKIENQELRSGYSFLGIKGGKVLLKNICIKELSSLDGIEKNKGIPDYKLHHDFSQTNNPVVSIITTVYDRVECLKNCIKSVKNLIFKDYEHIIISDAPSTRVVESIMQIIKQEDNGKIFYANLNNRFNDWGITPASLGLKLSRGKYVCFLSDDNGYAPNHLSYLVKELESNATVGFVYSSCQYDGRKILNYSVPKPVRIDLGQPLFRRELFDLYLNDTLPFNVYGWDWEMINSFLKQGVRWLHVDKPTFIFRLAKYPQFIAK